MPLAPDLLAALVDAINSNALLQAMIPDGAGGVQVHTDSTATPDGYPYLLIEEYEEDTPGETLEDFQVHLVICVFHSDLDMLRDLATVVKTQLDTPGTSLTGLRTQGLVWTGGHETGLVRWPSKQRRLKYQRSGINTGASVNAGSVWREDIRYVFWAMIDP
jgi:hypothetical protein